MDETGKIIAIWGNPNSGKTTTAVKLAIELAKSKMNVILVLTSISAPDINVILPFEKNNNKTMGNIWSEADIKEEIILNECVLTKYKNICILGYKHGENIFSHSEYTRIGIVKNMLMLKEMADYIIIDCVSDFPNDTLSTVALELADDVIRLYTADLKANAFFDSNLSMLSDSRFGIDEHTKVLSKVKNNQANHISIGIYPDTVTELPYIDEIEEQMLSGDLFTDINGKKVQPYKNGITQIYKIITASDDSISKSSNKNKNNNKIKKPNKSKETNNQEKKKLSFRLPKLKKGEFDDEE